MKIIEVINPALENPREINNMNNKQLLKDTIGWGFILWLIGYILGILLFFVLPASLIGWVITPIGVIITLWVLVKKVKSEDFPYYLWLAIAWTVIAVVCDYFLIVKAFKPADGYYKPDVYLYYALTFIMPLIVGWWKKSKLKSPSMG
jgi:uncharacterized membrane protein